MLKDESIKKLSAISTPKVYKKGQYIFYEGEPGNEMFIILRGSVGIYVTNSSDTLSEVACLKAGEIFGEMAVFDSLPRSASCVAAEDLICIAIGKDDIEPAVAVGDLAKARGLENMDRLIARDPVYAAMVYV